MRRALCICLLLSLTAAGCRRSEEPPMQAPPGAMPGERTQVLNADVMVIDGRHIRLADVSAPQPIPAARCWAEALAAKQATAEVRLLVRAGRDLRIEPTGETDGHGRTVARVLLDNQDLADTLHGMGLVARSPPGRFVWCNPISKGGAGAPELRALMDFSRG